MTAIELSDLQAELQRRIERQAKAEMIQICQDGKPIAIIHYVGAVPPPSAGLRPIGTAQGTFTVSPSFFEPLPDDLLALFNGESS